MRILFINPCIRRGAPLKILPVGLASVMTYVASRGYSFELLDVDLNEYDDDYVERYLAEHRFDVVLYGAIVTHYAWIKWLTRTVKRLQPHATVVVGNSVAGSCAEVFMANAPADVVVHGEGEVTCAAVLDALRDGRPLDDVTGISFRAEGDTVIKNPSRRAGDVNELPRPDWSHFDVREYLDRSGGTTFGSERRGARSMPVSTARGCAFRCTFCHFVFWDDPYRVRDPELVMEEVRHDIEVYGADYINFWDDLSFASLKQLARMLDAIESSGLEFEWSAAIRTDLFGREKASAAERREVARRMRSAGCTAVGFSLESADPTILELMNKKVKPEYFTEQVDVLREAGIVSNVSVVFGYPIETRETIEATFDMCLAARTYPSIGYLLPLPSTEMYEYAKQHGFIVDEDAYLTSITERQDLCVNLTALEDDEVLGLIADGARRLNEALELGLDDLSLVKTGGYKRHTNRDAQLGARDGADAKPKRNENDFSFNYSNTRFDLKTTPDC